MFRIGAGISYTKAKRSKHNWQKYKMMWYVIPFMIRIILLAHAVTTNNCNALFIETAFQMIDVCLY
jgi:hypothetical protein